MTQTERVLKAARRYNGVCQADFLGDTPDEGPSITRVAARLWDLETQGYCFEHIGWRNKTKVFRLCDSPDDAERGGREPGFAKPSPSTSSLSTDRLFEVGKAQYGYGEEEDAA